MNIETTDLYFGAYLMNRGVHLAAMNIHQARQQRVVFEFKDNGRLDMLAHTFHHGQALINPIEYKKSILQLKDLMYDRLRTKI